MLCQCSWTMRRLLAGLLAAAGLAYFALGILAYQETTPPASLGPELGELRRLLFNPVKPVSPMERRLEASDTPLGAGPLISGPASTSSDIPAASMRFAITGPANQLASRFSSQELAEREGERQALLAWIRSGASRSDYERDDYQLAPSTSLVPITPRLLVREASASPAPEGPRVRIRSLINERCVTCHNEADGDDTARLVPFDTYASVARYLVPDEPGNTGRPWLLASLYLLFPLAALAGLPFFYTSHPIATRTWLLALTTAALLSLYACWLAGPPLFGVLLAAAAVAIVGVMLQLAASIAALLTHQQV